LSPAPSTIVVLSLSIGDLLGLAEHVELTFSSLMPRSSLITWPPVRIAMSSSIALRRSPKPGALTAATLRPPRSLLTTRVASASPSTSSAMISSGGPTAPPLQQRQQRLQVGELLLVDQDVGIGRARPHLLGLVMK
jgi:hypothetical protein